MHHRYSLVRNLVEPSTSPFPASRLVRFRVDQSWREEVPREVQVRTGSGGGDCGYTFIKGVRYLVFARRNGEQLNTSICSPTKPISDAGEDLEYLKTAFKPSVAGRIFGRVTFQRTDHDAPVRPLNGYAVTQRRYERRTRMGDTSSMESARARTASGWTYRRPSVPSARRRSSSSIRGDVWRPISMSLFVGRISARLVRADGQPARGQTLESVTLESLQEADRFPSSGNQNSQREESRQVH